MNDYKAEELIKAVKSLDESLGCLVVLLFIFGLIAIPLLMGLS